MILTRVAPLGGNPFAGPGPAYQPSVGGRTTDTQCRNRDHCLETPDNSPRSHYDDWRKPQSQLLTSSSIERGVTEGAVLGPMGGYSGWCIPHHGSPTSLDIGCNGAQDAVWGPRGGQDSWCMSPPDTPTSQTPRHDTWFMHQHEPWTSPSDTGLCISQKCNGAEEVGYYVQVSMVMMIPMCSRFAQDPNQRPNVNLPASGGGLHTETSQNRSGGGWHENVGGEDDPRQPRTTRDLAPPGANVAASREVPAEFTLEIRNIPARYTRNMLLQEFGGQDGSFDLFFMPYSFRDSKTVGIAFINFRSHHAAARFQERWHRRFLWDHRHNKHLDVAAATIQGLVGNLKQFNPKSIARLERVGMLPVFFDRQGNHLNSIRELRRHGILP